MSIRKPSYNKLWGLKRSFFFKKKKGISPEKKKFFRRKFKKSKKKKNIKKAFEGGEKVGNKRKFDLVGVFW